MCYLFVLEMEYNLVAEQPKGIKLELHDPDILESPRYATYFLYYSLTLHWIMESFANSDRDEKSKFILLLGAIFKLCTR